MPHRIDSKSTPRPALRRHAPRRVASTPTQQQPLPQQQPPGQTSRELPARNSDELSKSAIQPSGSIQPTGSIQPSASIQPTGEPTPDAWLSLHASELISQLQAWALELDDREAKLDEREFTLEQRCRADARQQWRRRMRSVRS
ncbi:MAG: hypothetical protein AAGG48_20495 [Planctomycetota bacterium]